MKCAGLETQSPRFAITPERNLPANDTRATAIRGWRKPIAPLEFLGWASRRTNGTVAATEDSDRPTIGVLTLVL
jgi:hypothetical protein